MQCGSISTSLTLSKEAKPYQYPVCDSILIKYKPGKTRAMLEEVRVAVTLGAGWAREWEHPGDSKMLLVT